MIARIRTTLAEYPRQFWILFWGTLVYAASTSLIFPFLSLYLSGKLRFSMTEIGVMYVAVAAVMAISQIGGGVIADRLGRKPVMALGLVCDAIPIAALGFAGNVLANITGPLRLGIIGVLVILFGLTEGLYQPAANAMVADLIPSDQRAKAYSLLRIVMNVGVAMGPAVGGFIASRSYLVLFLSAAIGSLVFGVIVALFIHETLPARRAGAAARAAISPTGFGPILADRTFMAFCGLYFLALMVYSQMNTTLPVFLNQDFGVSEAQYGLLMSLNAAMVVVVQFPLTHWLVRHPKGRMMALGVLCFGIGFGMFAFVGALPLFFLAQAIWTTGEMITSPIAQAYTADVAPTAMRGRYLAFYSLMWGIATGVGPMLGGLAMDRWGGRVIWYSAIAINVLAALGFIGLTRQMRTVAPAAVAEIE